MSASAICSSSGHRSVSGLYGEGVVARACSHTLYIAQSPKRMTLHELGDVIRESIVRNLHKNADTRPISVYHCELSAGPSSQAARRKMNDESPPRTVSASNCSDAQARLQNDGNSTTSPR